MRAICRFGLHIKLHITTGTSYVYNIIITPDLSTKGIKGPATMYNIC